VPWKSSKKRLAKAYERSLRWFQMMRSSTSVDWTNTQLFGVALPDFRGNYEPMIAELLSAGVRGIVIGGACMGEADNQLLMTIRMVRELVPPSLPILVQGTSSLLQVNEMHARRYNAPIVNFC
jgi:tRNA-guanine family transglycosylase